MAYKREVPVEMVTVKKLASDYIKELAKCQYKNLLAILELYQSKGVFFIITDYIAVTLKQIITILLPLEELHVSTTYR